VVGGQGSSAGGMDKAQISSRLKEIKKRLDRDNVIDRADADFLSQIARSHTGYYEANRLLGAWYYKSKDYRRQAEVLEEATRRGRYKHDPSILLSLAKAYGHQRKYRKALKAMSRVERKMRRLKAADKADAFRFHAEMYQFEFQRQYHDDPRGANISLLDKAITKWERFRTLNSGSGKADKAIKKLRALKRELEL
jgi:tetratricopeptide (TPR) repeat protein